MKRALLIGALAIAAGGCHHHPAPQPNKRPPQTIYIPQDVDKWAEQRMPLFKAEHGDTVNVIMNPDTGDAQQLWCDNHGGELIYNPYTDISTCEKVDF